jgi:PAS domain S-box-containing protein
MFTETDRALLSKPGVHRCETQVRYVDDTVHDVLFIKSTFTDLEGNVAGLVGVLIDITDIKMTEKALKERAREFGKLAADFDQKRRFLRCLIDSIPDLIFFKDNSGAYLGCNKAFADFAGRAEEKLLGHTDPDIFPKEVAELFSRIDRQALSLGTVYRNEEWADYPDGRRVLLDALRTPYYDHDGHVLGLIGICRDISDRKRIEEERKKLEMQLLHAQKMEAIGQLAGGIAHDFNNILTVIIGYSEIIAMRLEKSSPLRRYVKLISTSAERASELTGGLLSFSRKQVLNTKPIDLCGLVRGMEKMLGRLIREDIDFRTTVSEKELIIMADEGKIEQVLMNLVTNAKDAMPKGGYLSVEVAHSVMDERFIHAHGCGEPGSYACISVSDTGHGMDDETQRNIFDPFFTTKEVGKGTGLGMSIVYGIIKQHNGYINVYSEPDRGTVFRIYLPIISKEKEGDKGAQEVSPSAGGTETILLAEDEKTVRELHGMILEEAGYTVIEAGNGKDAFDKFMENKAQVDILALDVIMPKIDGKTLYEEIRKVRPDMKALFMSGYTKDIVMDRGILEDEFSFMSKPIKAAELLKEVRRILDRH